jgi:hypothetical protein
MTERDRPGPPDESTSTAAEVPGRRDGDDREVSPDRRDAAPSALDADRTGPSRDPANVPEGHVARSEPWTETAESAEAGIRFADNPQAGEPATLPGGVDAADA